MPEFLEERMEHWVTLLRARAIENQLFVVGVNCVGGDKGYPRRSAIIDPLGRKLSGDDIRRCRFEHGKRG